MEKMALVSVIMAAYNEDLKWVKESIESILNQTYRNFEFIIVLDNPKYSELEELLGDYAKKDNRIKLIKNIKNVGESKSFNIASSFCTGQYIMIMHADDVAEVNRIEMQKECLEKMNVDFLISGITFINEKGEILLKSSGPDINNEMFRKVIDLEFAAPPSSWFMRPEVFRELKGFRDVPYCPDYDFILRSMGTEYKLGKMGESVVKYRIRDTSISRSHAFEQFLNAQGIRKLYNKGKLEDINLVNEVVKNSKNKQSGKTKEKFRKASELNDKAVRLWRRTNKIPSLFYIISSCLAYRRYVKVYIGLFKKKVGLKIYT